MDRSRLLLAERLGGTLLQAPACVPLVIAERIARHGAPTILVLTAATEPLERALLAMGALQSQGLVLNMVGALDPGTGLREALQAHRRRIGALLCAFDSEPAWPEDRPLLAKRLPGRIRASAPLPLAPARVSPLERSLLQTHYPEWPEPRLARIFIDPPWEPDGGTWVARWWPGVPLPAGAEILRPGLELATVTPLAEALRSALRTARDRPVPMLPLDADPSRLLALRPLCADVQVFQGQADDWSRALTNLARLPAPPHFCARC